MKRATVLTFIVFAASIQLAPPSHALCSEPRIVSTLFPRGTYSYIHTITKLYIHVCVCGSQVG